MATANPQPDLIRLLIDQHRAVEKTFARLDELADTGGSTSDEIGTLVTRAIKDLVAHSVAEEVHLYPTVREQLAGGHDLADQEVAEHQAAEQTMQQLEELAPTDDGFWATLARLMAEIRQHVHEEETVLLPRLGATCTDEELVALGNRLASTEKTAPTRPHPSVPPESGLLAGLAPGAGLVDRVRDALAGRSG